MYYIMIINYMYVVYLFILIFSMQGISRSVSFLIAYLMRKNKWKYEEAFNLVSSKRNCACPNNSFKKQLIEYEFEVLNNNY